MEKQIQEWMPQIIEMGIKVIVALVALVVAFMVAGWAKNIFIRVLTKYKVDQTLIKFGSNIVRWGVLAIAVIGILGTLGVQTTSFAAILGAMGIAVGMALQGSLGNIASGVMLLIFRPFKVGDVIKVGGEVGKVDEIALFVTTLDTPDNRRIIIPNSAVTSGTIQNLTHHDARRVDVAVGCDYGADMEETRAVLMKAIASVKHQHPTLAPMAYLAELGDSSLAWSVRVWCNQEFYWDVREQLTVAVKRELDAAGIGIPYPQMDVHHDNIK